MDSSLVVAGSSELAISLLSVVGGLGPAVVGVGCG